MKIHQSVHFHLSILHFIYPDSTIGSPGTPPAAIRFDSLSWTLTNTSIIVPNNFPVVKINPTIDSTNIRQGRQVNWYSLPGTYFFNTPGLDTLRLTVYASTDEGCGTQQTYDFEIEITDPPNRKFHLDQQWLFHAARSVYRNYAAGA